MTASAFVVRLRHRFGPAFSLDIDIDSTGPTLALVGPSGSGKSSVLDAVAGIWAPDHARVQIGERLLADTERGLTLAPRARRVGLVPQAAWLFPLLTVRQNLEFGRPSQAQLDVDEVAAALEVDPLLDRRPRMLSGGERQRVALGRALLSEPDVLACDEPLSALDAARRQRLLGALREIRETLDVPMLFVSHDHAEVSEIADSVVRLDGGRVVDQSRPGDRGP